MTNKEKFEKIEERLDRGDFLKFRNYRDEQSYLILEFWEIVSMILLTSKSRNKKDEYFTPLQFQLVVAQLFNHTFLNIDKTQAAIREIPRSVGLNRAYWEGNKIAFLEIKNNQNKIIKESGLILHQSITMSVNSPDLIKRADPKMVSIHVFDRWHKKLNQPVSFFLENLYPEQLIEKSDDDSKLRTAISINNVFIKSYHHIATDMMIASYIRYLIDRIDGFFNDNPNISTFNEDLLV